MQPASLKSDSNSSAAVWGSFCGGPLANFKFRIGRSWHCTMMLSYYIYRGQLSPLWWFLFFLNYLICSILCYIVFGASPCWPTWNGFHWTNSSFTHSLWCNIPPPPPVVSMLAAIMRGFFIIHIMIDLPLVVVFMPQSHMIVLCQEHPELPNTAVHRLRC